jgi:hypothetical protein
MIVVKVIYYLKTMSDITNITRINILLMALARNNAELRQLSCNLNSDLIVIPALYSDSCWKY